MKVFLHLLINNDPTWHNFSREFKQLPAIGEYVSLRDTVAWYEVCVVVHAPPEDSQYEAEIYAIEVDHSEVLKNVRESHNQS